MTELMTSKHGISRRRPIAQLLLWSIARAVAAVLLLTTAVTLLAQYHWVADLLANLRVQQCLGLFAVSVTFLALRRWTWLAAMTVCLAVHVPWFLYAYEKPVKAETNAKHLTITLANVASRNQRYKDIVTDVLKHNPDVFVILELNSALAQRLASLGNSAYVDSVVRPMDDGNFGIGLYSRHPIVESEVFKLNSEIESISAKIRVEGKSYRILATHPFPPIGSHAYRSRNEHLRQLADMIRDTMVVSEPTILVGDFNLTPWSPHFARFQNASELCCAVGSGLNVTPTWYGYPAFPFGLVLDHAMVSQGIVCTGHVVGPDIGSDHRSVTITLASVTRELPGP